MHRVRLVTAALISGALLAGCGEDVPEREVQRELPGITIGEGGQYEAPYEAGGADGSGADGEEKRDSRGGVAGGPDTKEPDERPRGDESTQPPATDDPS
jgi:hypothetical protein